MVDKYLAYNIVHSFQYTSSGNWEVEVEAGKESDSVDFDVDIDETAGKTTSDKYETSMKLCY